MRLIWKTVASESTIPKLSKATLLNGGLDVAHARSLLNETLASIPPLEDSLQSSLLKKPKMRAVRLEMGSKPLLQKRGLQLVVREADNFSLPAYPGLILKDSYWRWPERNLAGNAIDFHIQVLGLSFHDAIRQITGT